MSDMDSFLGDQIAKAYEKDSTFDRLQNRGLKKVNADQDEALQAKSSYVIELQNEVAKLRDQLSEANQEASTANMQKKKAQRGEAQYKEAYKNQIEVMAEWMVSQKAFKELAIQFGFELGHTAEETIEMGNEKKIDVLDNKHNPEHGSNANGLPFLEERSAKLKSKLLDK